MNRKFQVGDRVRIRAKGRRIVGSISQCFADGTYLFSPNEINAPCLIAYPEQLIRLVKKAKPKPEEPKPPEVIWVPKDWHEDNKADVRSGFNNLMDFLSEYGYPSTCHKYKLLKEGEE